ncbi:C25 family cysteine peptidase [Spirosoma oryzicola]|uniref:putative type IX secretion system sortase PorU2 n=1 Tax=Spirosoma oryzicola TaxID=2898794 RepID=UPI001E597D08|nr:C25 family cysteine peptidase [Spirosoma oryzicola]UHG93042.1 C25 family cysteine peptidase [Spirosoma oryzicola]
MRKGLLFVYFLVNVLTLQAQHPFGNEWIRPDQRYLKFSVNKAGVYRISYQDIQAADPSFLPTNPANWQLFFRGQEVALRVVGQQDSRFDRQDYLEFYGEGNDGSQDSLLYRPQKRLHPYQSLFSDETAYFLTSSPSVTGKRIPELNLTAKGLTAEAFHVEETVQAFTSEYTFNPLKGLEPLLQHSYYEPGEGWSGRLLTIDSVGTVQLPLTNRVAANWPITLEAMVNGRDYSNHTVRVTQDEDASNPLATLNFSGFTSQLFQQQISPSSLKSDQLRLTFKGERVGFFNTFSITYAKISYPQALDMTGQRSKLFHLPAKSSATALLSIKGAPSAIVAYDITDKFNCRYVNPLAAGDQMTIVVDEATRSRTILVTDQIEKPLAIKAVHFKSTFSTTANYLILTHSTLQQSAVAYANYRASDQGGSHKPLVVFADSLYDQFNYGEKSPLALRRFADFMLAQAPIKNLLLIGKACSYPYFVKTAPDDLVPTIGYPGSDILLTAGLNGYSLNTPAIPTGRLNVTANEQVFAYLEKVKQLENTTPNGLWRKNIIHISGGKSKEEAQRLRGALSTLGDVFTNGLLGGQVNAFSKNNTYEEVEPLNITPLVNDGVGLITFFGHAGPSITDMNFGFASPLENGYRNKVYPLMIFNGCGVGEIFSRFTTLSTDWLLAPEKGSALVLAHSYLSFEQPTSKYLSRLYASLYTDPTTLGMPFGKVQQRLNMAAEKEGIDLYDTSVMLEMVLQGDPALSLYPLPNPDYTVGQKGIYLQSSVGGSSIKNSDSVRVVIPLANLGRFASGQPVTLSLKKTTNTGTSATTLRFDAFRYRDTLTYTIPKDATLSKIDVVIDPTNQITELDKANNSASLRIDWARAEVSSSYPADALPDVVSPTMTVFINGAIKENGAVVDTNPKVDVYLTDENALTPGDTNAVELYLKECATCAQQRLYAQATNTAISANQVRVSTRVTLKANTTYTLIVIGKDAAGNRTQPPYIVNLTTLGADEPITVQTYPNPASTYAKFELTLNVQDLPIASQLTVYNTSGERVFEGTVPLSMGKNTVLWQGTAPGLYPYQLQLTWKDGRTQLFTGKVLWQP